METAFINRVGITSGWGYAECNFYPDKTKYPWLRRVSPFSFTQGGRDRNAGGNELLEVAGVRLQLHAPGLPARRPLRRLRDLGRPAVRSRQLARSGNVQLYRWLLLDGQTCSALAVFYDPEDPFQGTLARLRVGFTLQPSGRLSQALSYSRVAFDRESTGERVYTSTSSTAGRPISSRASSSSAPSRSTTARATGCSPTSWRRTSSARARSSTPATDRSSSSAISSTASGCSGGALQTSQRGLFFKASYLHRF